MSPAIKSKTLYICQNCSFESPNWLGQCPQCMEWNTFVESVVSESSRGRGGGSRGGMRGGGGSRGGGLHSGGLHGGGRGSHESGGGVGGISAPVLLSQAYSQPPKRISSNISEFDRVLGGGFVPGQVVLLAGEPGIGKSTLLTQLAKSLFKQEGGKILYVCGEESIEQVKIRAQRMGYSGENLLMLAETNVENIIDAIESGTRGHAKSSAKTETDNISLIIIDSIQTLYTDELLGMAGSVGQVKESTQILTNVAKKNSIPLILVGHVTKEGAVAGPKVLEHIVDTVLYLEGDAQHLFRILKTAKNRFGPVSEAGIFEMTEEGMMEVKNPSQIFLSQKLAKSAGSCVTVVMEGFRPLLFEIQALAVKTSFGYPRRTTSGFNTNRLLVLIAILEKIAGLNLSSYDVYLSVAGGFKVSEYATDLAVCMAIASSIKNKPIKETTAVFGECGLAGEVRQVPHQEKRIKEAKRLGYTNVISPDKVRSLREALSLI